METYENAHRFAEDYKWETLKHQPYNYSRDGLISRILSHKVTETTNPLLKELLSYYEYSLTYMLRFADNLKHFKNFNWKNR